MKSMTIHGLDNDLDNLIREKARNQNTSLNKTIKNLLEEALGISAKHKKNRKEDFLDLFGIWSKDDVKEFNKAIKDFEKIDPEDWS